MSPRLDLNALNLSTKTIPAQAAIGTYISSTIIKAPATSVWQAVIDTDPWPIWNTFCPGATIREQPNIAKSQSGRLQLGTKMTLHLNWNPRGPKPKPMDVGLVVTEFDSPTDGRQTPARIAWATDSSAKGFPPWLLYAERVTELHEFEEGDGEECQRVTQVVSWESQRGPLAYVVRWFMAKNFKMCLKVQADDMTSFVEGKKASS